MLKKTKVDISRVKRKVIDVAPLTRYLPRRVSQNVRVAMTREGRPKTNVIRASIEKENIAKAEKNGGSIDQS